jgi:hypothetical protein
MAINDPTTKARMTAHFARRQVAQLAARLKRLAARLEHPNAVAEARHGCERIERLLTDLDAGEVEPRRALEEAEALFDRLSALSGTVGRR